MKNGRNGRWKHLALLVLEIAIAVDFLMPPNSDQE